MLKGVSAWPIVAWQNWSLDMSVRETVPAPRLSFIWAKNDSDELINILLSLYLHLSGAKSPRWVFRDILTSWKQCSCTSGLSTRYSTDHKRVVEVVWSTKIMLGLGLKTSYVRASGHQVHPDHGQLLLVELRITAGLHLDQVGVDQVPCKGSRLSTPSQWWRSSHF